MQRLYRLSALVLTLLAAAAAADVYQNLGYRGLAALEDSAVAASYTPLQSLTALLSLQPHPLGRRVIDINGQRLFAELSFSPLSPAQLIARLRDEDYRSRAVAGGHTTPFGATPFGATPFGATPFGATPFGATPFYMINDDWAVLGHLNLDGLGSASAEGELPYVVLAVRNRAARLSEVWALQPRSGFDLGGLFAAGADEDVAGVEPEDLPRAKGTRRVFALSEHSALGESHVIGFEGEGPVNAYLEHYRRGLREAGYHSAQSGGDAAQTPLLLAHNQAGRQVGVSVHPPRTAGEPVLVLLQIRMEPAKTLRLQPKVKTLRD